MRYPWIQVTQDAMVVADHLASMTGTDSDAALGKLVRFWAWAVSIGPDDKPPEGLVTGPLAAERIAAALRLSTEPVRLVAILEALGLVERTASGFRVRGLDRYKATWEKNRRRTGTGKDRTGTGPADDSNPPDRNETGPAPDRQTQTQTHVEEEAVPVEPVGPPEQPELFTATTTALAEKPKPIRADSPLGRWKKWALEERRRLLPLAPEPDALTKPQAINLNRLFTAEGEKKLEAAWRAFCAEAYPRSVNLPLGLFLKQSAQWLTKGEQQAGAQAKQEIHLIGPDEDLHGGNGPTLPQEVLDNALSGIKALIRKSKGYNPTPAAPGDTDAA